MPIKEGYKRMTIDLKPPVSDALKLAAKREEATVTYVIRKALRQYIVSRKNELPG
jgi:predicted transcriptional regulator